MTKREWRFMIISAIILGAAIIFYLMNLDIYKLEGNYWPVQGILDFYTHLTDIEYLSEHYLAWEHSNSPALHNLFSYLHSEGDIPLTAVTATPVISVLLSYIPIAFPFYYVLIIIRIRQRKRKALEQNEETPM